MSYSFAIQGATKAEAVTNVEAELDKVVAAQPSHTVDRQAARDAVVAFLDVVRDPRDGEYVGVSVSGSLSWQEANVFTGASINVSAYVARKT